MIMALTNVNKRILRQEVKLLKKAGWKEADVIERMCKIFFYKAATVKKYWKIFTEANGGE